MNALARNAIEQLSATHKSGFVQLPEETGPAVLFVDDDTFALEEMKDISGIEGWNAITADNIDDAVQALEANPTIRIIVTDVHFAEASEEATNGIQFVSRSKARFHDRDLRYIVLSGDPDSMESSVQEEAVAFLSKPLNPDQLIFEVTKAMAEERSPMYWRLNLADAVQGIG